MKILFVCTGNSCRSAMAEGIVRKMAPDWRVFSAGIKPEKKVSSFAVEVLKEKGIDISAHQPRSIVKAAEEEFDVLVSLSGTAMDYAAANTLPADKHLHIKFTDPAEFEGSKKEKLEVYRKTRDEINEALDIFVRVWKANS
jgi:arsenate reductase